MLDEKLKKVIQWTIFILILVISIAVILIPVIVTIYFPDSELAKNSSVVIGVASGIIGFLSAILGVVSVFQSSASSKQVERILGEIKSISDSQKMMFNLISEHGTSNEVGKTVSSTDKVWPNKDDVGE